MIELRPQTIEEARAQLSQLGREKKTCAFLGSGTKLMLGALPRTDAQLRTAGLARIVEYEPADQVVSFEAGIALAALQNALAKERQRLSLDPPFAAKATLGGIIAAASSGPRRMRYGAVRDLILGVSIVRSGGELARSGGKVVKNVAGFDLPKLVCGSLGTLGLIAAATIRVHPLPEAEASLIVRSLSSEQVPQLLDKIRAAQIEPAAMVASRTGPDRWDVAVLFEGFEAGVKQQEAKLRAVAPADRCDPWADHAALRERGELRLKISALPTALPQVESELFSRLPGARAAWYPTLGLGFVSMDAAPIAAELEFARRSFRVVVEAAPAGSTLDRWGPPPQSLRLQKAVKARLDPEGLLAPGSFVGGI